MGHFIQPRTICNSGPPLDCIDVPTPAHGYGFNRLRAGYTGKATRNFFENNGNEADIGFGGTNSDADDFDIESWDTLAAGVDSTDMVRLAKWYDQFGSSDFVQTTAANRPLTSDTTGQTHGQWSGGQLAVSFDGVSDYLSVLDTTLGQYDDADCTMFALGGTEDGADYDFVMSAYKYGTLAGTYWGATFAHDSTVAGTAGEPTFERFQGTGWKSILGTTSNENTYGSLVTRYDHGGAVDMDMRLNDTAQGTEAFTGATTTALLPGASSPACYSYLGRSGANYGKIKIQMLLLWTERLTDKHLTELERLKTWAAGHRGEAVSGAEGGGGGGGGEEEGGGP